MQVSALLAEVAPWRAAVELREPLPPGPKLRYESSAVALMLSGSAQNASSDNDQAAKGSGEGPSSTPRPDSSLDD